MEQFKNIDDYINSVEEQIRWKKARPLIADELRNHIIDQRDAFVAQGMDEAAATAKSIAETGSAADIGLRLDMAHRPKPQWGMLGLTAALLTLNLLIRLIFGAHYELWENFSSIMIGTVVMTAAYFTDFTIIGRHPKALFFSAIALSVAIIFFSPSRGGNPILGAYMIMIYPLVFASVIFASRNEKIKGLIKCGLAFIVLSFLALYMRPAVGYTVYMGAVIPVFGIASYKRWFGVKRLYGFLCILAVITIIVLLFFVSFVPLLLKNLAVSLNPNIDPYGRGYMFNAVREILKGAKFIGVGTISPKYIGFVQINTDYFLLSLISNAGWLAFVIVLAVILFFIVKGLSACLKQKSGLGLFVSLSILLVFSIQVVTYTLFNLGVTIYGPLALPLLSFGKVATIVNMGLIGFMLSVFRSGSVVKDEFVPN